MILIFSTVTTLNVYKMDFFLIKGVGVAGCILSDMSPQRFSRIKRIAR